jgi:spore coat protein U-like protein
MHLAVPKTISLRCQLQETISLNSFQTLSLGWQLQETNSLSKSQTISLGCQIPKQNTQAQSGLFPSQQTRARKKSIFPPSLSTVAT